MSRRFSRLSVRLWTLENVCCTCRTYAPDDIEIAVSVDGLALSREVFSDRMEAADYAADVRHLWGVLRRTATF